MVKYFNFKYKRKTAITQNVVTSVFLKDLPEYREELNPRIQGPIRTSKPPPDFDEQL